MALFAENINWEIPGDEERVPWLGRRTRREELHAFYTLLWSSVEPLTVQVDDLLVDGPVAVISGSFTSKMLPTGKIVDSLFFIRITVADGLIATYRLLEDSYAVSVAMTP